jgi:hypothetical protein
MRFSSTTYRRINAHSFAGTPLLFAALAAGCAGVDAEPFEAWGGLGAGGPYSSVATGVLTTSWVDKTVKNGTTYHYVIRAQNPLGTSSSSSSASATPSSG